MRPPPTQRSLFSCSRRRARCRRRSFGERVTFHASVEVNEYSRAFGHDSIPGDGTDLAIGLGIRRTTTSAPLAKTCQQQARPRVEDNVYLPIEDRQRILAASLQIVEESSLFLKHRTDVNKVHAQRAEAMDDEKEPRMLMPTSYEEARERALRAEKEADICFSPARASSSSDSSDCQGTKSSSDCQLLRLLQSRQKTIAPKAHPPFAKASVPSAPHLWVGCKSVLGKLKVAPHLTVGSHEAHKMSSTGKRKLEQIDASFPPGKVARVQSAR